MDYFFPFRPVFDLGALRPDILFDSSPFVLVFQHPPLNCKLITQSKQYVRISELIISVKMVFM